MNLSDIKINRISYSASILFHLFSFLLLFLIKCTFEYPAKDYVELTFGIMGGTGSSGTKGEAFDEMIERADLQDKDATKEKNQEVKEVELPKAKNTDVSDVNPAQKDKDVKKETTKKTDTRESNNPPGDKKGNLNNGEGEYGFHFEGGGLGTRRIISYVVPDYPEGVNKEIDIRLKFTIKPDGTVGSIFLLTKADTRLENAAINSLWKWRFEALPSAQQGDQTAIIVFPYRLQ